MVCAAPKRARCQLQHIVAGERFHWSRASASVELVSHRTRKQSRGSAEATRMQSGSSMRPLCFHSPHQHQHECEGARSGRSTIQTKVKDRFLNQRRWTCWYSFRENMQVLSATASLVLLFVLFWKLVIFAVYLTFTLWRLSLFFYIIIWLLSVC